jgi:hypothetical protein
MSELKEEELKGKALDTKGMFVSVLHIQASIKESIAMQARILAKLNGTTVEEELNSSDQTITTDFHDFLRSHLIPDTE